ncbi:MAG: D-tyrosyl-tRNA(Tyr) deacylase [Thermoleophilia bacterium]|nr:D-tyrosyl-tRNA(Tyr) deacylase [Thermoleophilia bacterium]
MRIVVQRVTGASVTVAGVPVASIGRGLLLLVGIAVGDDVAIAHGMAAKIVRLRLFPGDGNREFDRSLADIGGEALVVSQFTLLGDVRRGTRPSWSAAAHPADAEPLVEALAAGIEGHGVAVGRGIFGAQMDVSLVNDGPVTLVVTSP